MGNLIPTPTPLMVLGVDLAIQAVAWSVAAVLKTEKFYDLVGSLTFGTTIFWSYNHSRQTLRQYVQSHMVLLWTARLGLFLFTRIMNDGKDPRFDQIKQNPLRFLTAWLLQGVWVFVTLLPTLMLNWSNRETPLGARDMVGWSMWTVGFAFEVVADFQKRLFRNDPANKGKFISTGLWSISRHPNYFGEILLWFGLYISASSVFKGFKFLSVLSPMFVYLLITRLSGIPMLEKSGLKKWGHLPEYQLYLKTTPPLVPFIHCL